MKIEDNKRLVWIDQLKAFGMFLVVLGHSIQRTGSKTIFRGIYSFHIPFFFILSGMTTNPSKYKRTIDFAIAKAKAILYPYLVMSLVLLPLWLYNRSLGVVQGDSIKRIIFGVFYSNAAEYRGISNVGWFMVTLYFAELFFYILYKYFKKDTELFICSLLFAVIAMISPLGKEIKNAPFHLDVAMLAQFFVCAGFLIRKHITYIFNAIRSIGKYKGVILMLLVAAFFAKINKTVDVSNEKYGNVIYMLITSFGFSLSFIYLGQKMPKINILSYIGRNTVIYLMIHVPILRTIQAFFPIVEKNQMYASLVAVCLFIAIIPVCYIVNKWFPFIIRFPKFKKKEVS